jgi:hypothetical protein
MVNGGKWGRREGGLGEERNRQWRERGGREGEGHAGEERERETAEIRKSTLYSGFI